MRMVLDGVDWEADYFISSHDLGLKSVPGNIDFMNLRDAGGAGFFAASYRASFHGMVPGDDRTMLLENGVISEPYYGRNLEHSSWSSRRSWGFRKSFVVPKVRWEISGVRKPQTAPNSGPTANPAIRTGICIGRKMLPALGMA